jgi:hypothetical protein
VRGLTVDEAMKLMEFSPKKAAGFVSRVVRVTANNAYINHDIKDTKNMYIMELYVGKVRFMLMLVAGCHVILVGAAPDPPRLTHPRCNPPTTTGETRLWHPQGVAWPLLPLNQVRWQFNLCCYLRVSGRLLAYLHHPAQTISP